MANIDTKVQAAIQQIGASRGTKKSAVFYGLPDEDTTQQVVNEVSGKY